MIAVLDANVLYPAPVRDLLLHLSDAKLLQPKWSARIHEEWTRNLLANRPDIPAKVLQKTVEAMNTAFPDADVAEDRTLEESLTLPDPDDRHVLVTANASGAECIITSNIKDFPASKLVEWHIEAANPDNFVALLFEKEKEAVRKAFYKTAIKLKNPPKTAAEVLAALAKCGLQKTVALLS